MPKIWILNDQFINVNDDGYLVGPYYEGALGVVLPLLGTSSEKERYALKIPRMLADTVRENAYIAKVTEDEERWVHEVEFGEEGGAGLIATKLIRHALRLRRTLDQASDQGAREQHNHAIFLSFEKGRPPRFCSYLPAKEGKTGEPSVVPPNVGKAVAGFADSWDKILAFSTDEGGRPFWKSICYVTTPEAEPHVHSLTEAIAGREVGPIWYAGIPNIIYEWGTITIQQAISDGLVGAWTLEECSDLFTTILSGLHTLHSSKMIHGDIRPANIMAVGDGAVPTRYRLIDYGSFSRDSTGPKQPTTGNTLVGAGVGQQRVTPFYSQERRAGIERESADTAVITTVPPDATAASKRPVEYVVRIGWRTALVEQGGQRPNEQVLTELRALQKSQTGGKDKKTTDEPETIEPERLYAGDRLRLQDYLFEVIDSVREVDSLTCRCSGRYAKVFHDHLAIYNAEGIIPDGTLLSLPRYTEYRQWSAATDLYGFGAVLLYTLFASSQATIGRSNLVTVDARFGESMNILDNVSYFNAFWPELEEFRRRLEQYYDEHEDTGGAGAADAPLDTEQTDDEGRPLNLRGLAIRGAQSLVQNVPHARTLLARCEDNAAKFLLILHFALSCFHRRSDLWEQTRKRIQDDEDTEWPFCRSRLDRPDGVISKSALDRLKRIKSLLDKKAMLGQFVCTEKEVPEFKPQSDPVIRLDNERLTRKLKTIGAQCVKWQDEMAKTGFGKRKETIDRILHQDLPTILNLTPQALDQSRAPDTEEPV